MKKLFLGLLIFFVLYNNPNSYNLITKFINCETEEKCYHEIGHAIDDALGWPSTTQKYTIALNAYLLYTWDYPEFRDDFSKKIITFPGFFVPKKSSNLFSVWIFSGGWGGQTELYADMFKWSQGKREKMPEFFIDFYDWDLAEKLIARYIGD